MSTRNDAIRLSVELAQSPLKVRWGVNLFETNFLDDYGVTDPESFVDR